MSVRKKTKANIGKHFSKLQLGLIVIIFASLGGYIIINSFAATSSVTPVPAANVNGVTVGGGFVEASARQVIRTANNTVYVITADDDLCQAGGAGVIHAWKGTGAQAANAQVPTAFVEQDAANRPTSTTGDCTFNSTHALFSPESRLDPSGVIEMAYINGSNSNVYYQTFSTITNTWGVPVVIGTNANTNSGGGWPRGGHVSLTLDSNNVPHVVYVTSGSSNQLMYTNKTSGSWSTPVSIASGTNMMHPSMVTSQDGNFHLAWLDNSLATHSTIKYSKHTSTGWSTTETVSAGDNLVLNNTDDDQGPSIVTNSSGEPYVLFMDGTGSASTQDNYVRMRYRNTAGTWQDNSPPNNLFAHTPQNYISSTGDIYAFLGHDVNVQFGYQSQTGGFGNSWNPYATLDPRNQTNTTAGAPGLDGSASVRYDPLRDNNPGIIDVIYYDENDGQTSGHHATVFYKAIVLSNSSQIGQTANLWVNTISGSSPTRCNTACPYDSTHAYPSLSAAYAAASAGDKVIIKPGTTYGTQTFVKRSALDNGTCVSTGAGCITFVPETGAVIKLGDLNFGGNYANDGPTNIKMDATGGTISTSGENFVRAHEIYLKNINVPGNVYMTGGTYISVYGGEYGPFSDSSGTHPEIQAVYNSSPIIMPQHIKFSGGYWHDYNTSNATAHVDCLQIESGQDFTLENSRFKNCGSVGVRVSYGTNRSAEAPDGVLIQNNVFDQCAAIPVSQCYYSAELGNGNNVVIRNNTFLQSEQPTTSNGTPSNVLRINNAGNLDGCQAFGTNITYSHNIWKGGTCNTSDKSFNSLLLNADGSPQSSSSPVVNAGDSSNCPSYDFLSLVRPQDATCDAGAYEYQSGTTPTCTKQADINCDNAVNVTDLSILLSNYGKTTAQLASSTPSYPRADINSSGKVDIGDLSALLTGYGK